MTDFDALYRNDPDPWAVGTAWYERRKRAVLMASLPRQRYRQALELGCGTGDATRSLAGRCEAVYAVDLSDTAIGRSRQALTREGIGNVTLAVMQLPAAWPLVADESADLIVVSELAYYFADPELDAFLARCLNSLAVDGDWIMCHYTCDFHDRRQATDRLHGAVQALGGLQCIVSHSDARFRLDVWRKQSGAGS